MRGPRVILSAVPCHPERSEGSKRVPPLNEARLTFNALAKETLAEERRRRISGSGEILF